MATIDELKNNALVALYDLYKSIRNSLMTKFGGEIKLEKDDDYKICYDGRLVNIKEVYIWDDEVCVSLFDESCKACQIDPDITLIDYAQALNEIANIIIDHNNETNGKKAYLVTFSPCVRVVVPSDTDEDEVIRIAGNKLKGIINDSGLDEVLENCENLEEDYEVPAEENEPIDE